MPASRAQQLRRLQALLPIWQARLGLRDWTIVLSVVSPHELALGTHHTGEVIMFAAKRAATIRIVDVNELPPPDYDFEGYQERTLVHELTHVHLDALCRLRTGRKKAFNLALEQAVHAISMALVTLAEPNTKSQKKGIR